RLTLGFVTILGLREIKLINLPLVAPPAALLAALAASGDIGLPCLELEQRLIGRLFRRERRAKCVGPARRTFEFRDGQLHVLRDRSPERLLGRIKGLGGSGLRLQERL